MAHLSARTLDSSHIKSQYNLVRKPNYEHFTHEEMEAVSGSPQSSKNSHQAFWPRITIPRAKDIWSSAWGWLGCGCRISAQKFKIHSILEKSLQPDFLWTLSNEGIASNCFSSLPEHGLGRESLTPANDNCPITVFSFPRTPNQRRIKIRKWHNLPRQYTTAASTTATAGVEYISEAAGHEQKSLFLPESL